MSLAGPQLYPTLPTRPGAAPGGVTAATPWGTKGGNPAQPQGTVTMPANAPSIAGSQVTDFVNNAKQYGLSGSFTTPTGITYNYNNPNPAGAGAAGSVGGTAPGMVPDINLSDLWQRTGEVGPPPVPTPLPPRITAPSTPDASAQEAAVFGRAKDKVGEETRGSLNALADEMNSRNMGNSTFSANAQARILTGGQKELADTGRSQAIDSLDRISHEADRNYQGNIGQRSQDIGYNQAVDSAAMAGYNSKRALLDRLIQLRMDGARVY